MQVGGKFVISLTLDSRSSQTVNRAFAGYLDIVAGAISAVLLARPAVGSLALGDDRDLLHVAVRCLSLLGSWLVTKEGKRVSDSSKILLLDHILLLERLTNS